MAGDPDTRARLGAAAAINGPVQGRLDAVVREVDRNALLVSQLWGAMRLPDPDTGRRPRRRPPRGVYRTRLV